MKAYIIGLESNPDVGNAIVFAKNGKEARKLADGLELTDTRENYIDVTVHRAPNFDGMENFTDRELMKVQWRHGWWFHQSGCPTEAGTPDEEFYRWYDRTFKKINDIEGEN